MKDVKQRFSEWQNLAVTLNKGYSKSKKETLARGQSSSGPQMPKGARLVRDLCVCVCVRAYLSARGQSSNGPQVPKGARLVRDLSVCVCVHVCECCTPECVGGGQGGGG